MNHINILLCLILFFSFAVYGQSIDQGSYDSLRRSDWSIQFKINQMAKLASFQDFEVSLKKAVSKTSALRFGLGEVTADAFAYGNILSTVENVYLDCQYIYKPSNNREVEFYYGAGPRFGFSHALYTGTFDFTWTAGVAAIIGAEWFATRSISLSGEYMGYGTYSWGRGNLNTIAEDFSHPEERHSIFNVNFSDVRLGLSIYFK